MLDLPATARLLYFADLRPTHVFDAPWGAGGPTVVALAVIEFPTVAREFDWDPLPVKTLIEAPDDDPRWGSKYDVTQHPVLALDEEARVIDDWSFFELDDALGYWTPFRAQSGNPLPSGRSEALSFIQQRLSEPPRE